MASNQGGQLPLIVFEQQCPFHYPLFGHWHEMSFYNLDV